MKLWFWALLVGLCALEGRFGAIDVANNPEIEALGYIFNADEKWQTGINRLKWHEAELRGVVRLLADLIRIKKITEEGLYRGDMHTLEEEWRMYDILIGLNKMSNPYLKFDVYAGDSNIFPKIAKHKEEAVFTKWLTDHINNWDSDFFKYIFRSDDFHYNISDPGQFVYAVYNIQDPAKFADKVGMTLQQLKQLNEAIRKAIIPRPEYYETTLLEIEITKEMCELKLVDCEAMIPSSIFGERTL